VMSIETAPRGRGAVSPGVRACSGMSGSTCGIEWNMRNATTHDGERCIVAFLPGVLGSIESTFFRIGPPAPVWLGAHESGHRAARNCPKQDSHRRGPSGSGTVLHRRRTSTGAGAVDAMSDDILRVRCRQRGATRVDIGCGRPDLRRPDHSEGRRCSASTSTPGP